MVLEEGFLISERHVIIAEQKHKSRCFTKETNLKICMQFKNFFFSSFYRYKLSILQIIVLFLYFSFSILWGPYNHMKHIFSYERLPFTAAYFGTMMATLYAALWVKYNIILNLNVLNKLIQIMKKIIILVPFLYIFQYFSQLSLI